LLTTINLLPTNFRSKSKEELAETRTVEPGQKSSPSSAGDEGERRGGEGQAKKDVSGAQEQLSGIYIVQTLRERENEIERVGDQLCVQHSAPFYLSLRSLLSIS